MNITTISLSYFFLAICIIALAFSLYFKTLVIKTEPNNKSRQKILGNMKDPVTWREKNNIMAYVSIFWSVISLVIFIYLKFFSKAGLISIVYVFIYVGLIGVTALYFAMHKKSEA